MREVKRFVLRRSGVDGVMPVNSSYEGIDKQYVLASDFDALRAELAEVKGRLVQNAARYEWLRDHYHGFEHYRKSTGTVANLDREIDEQIAALSTWRQAHTPSTLPASSAEE